MLHIGCARGHKKRRRTRRTPYKLKQHKGMKKFLKKEEVARLAELVLAEVENEGTSTGSLIFSREYDGTIKIAVGLPTDEEPFRTEVFGLMPEPCSAADALDAVKEAGIKVEA